MATVAAVAEERRFQAVELVVLILAFAGTAIVWWTFAPAWWPDASDNVLLAGEIAFQVVVVFGGAALFRRLRRRPDRSRPSPADLDR